MTIEASTEVDEGTAQSANLSVEGRIDALDFELTTTGPAALDGRGSLRGLPGTPSVEADFEGA